MAHLQVLKGEDLGGRIMLDKDKITLGREPDCDVFLNSLAVSRRHAEIAREGGKHFITDSGTSNGTWVNNKKIENSRTLLRHNDRIRITDYVFEFVNQAPTPGHLAESQTLEVQVSAYE